MNYIDNIILNENAYFYQKTSEGRLTKTIINQVFKQAVKDGKKLLREVSVEYTFNDIIVNYSILVFSYKHNPTFLLQTPTGWEEKKLAYLVILDFDKYVVISKKNVSGIQKFLNKLVPLDYRLISTLLVNDETEFEKFSMQNLDFSDNSIRSKSLEANNLKDSFFALGANTYIINNLRFKSGDEKINISPSTSRINKFSKKNNIFGFIEWSKSLLDKIETYIERETYLSIFAEPQSYSKLREGLSPIAILLNFTRLYNDLESSKIDKIYYESSEGQSRELNIIKSLEKFRKLNQVTTAEEGSLIYKINNKTVKDLELKLSAKSIRLQSKKLRKVKIKKDNANSTNLLEYLNNSNSFTVNFENVNLIYSNRKLFKDSRLLGNVDSFMNIFLPFNELRSVTSEKGIFTTEHTRFDDNSVFGFVENEYKSSYEYFICDDLGNEWADHIGLGASKISFFHSKYKETNQSNSLSASAFQDIIGQAQKNLGNLTPAEYQWSLKQQSWQNFYKKDNVTTQINKLRRGNDVTNAIDFYKQLVLDPNLKREVYLIVNFISKQVLQDEISKLKNDISSGKRKQVIQIIWFINSLIASCKEIGVDVFICCKP